MNEPLTTPHGTVTIRPAQATDLHAFRSLRLEALQNHPEAFSSDYASNLAQPMAFWSGRLQDVGENGTIFFATHQDKLIGMCGIRRGDSPKTKHEAGVWGVYVQAGWRSFHIAEELIASCTDWAQQHGVKIVRLAVVTANTAAIRCYVRCGFEVYGVAAMVIYHDGVMYDELLMARKVVGNETKGLRN